MFPPYSRFGTLFQETPMAFSARAAAGKETEGDGTSRLLAKLLGFDTIDTSERKPKLNPFSAELVDSLNASRISGKELFRSDERRKESDQGKRRVRRRCPAGQWPCHLPTSPSRKHALP